MAGPIDGIRVLDFGLPAVGPWSTTILGALGADVIKIERPDGRRLGGTSMSGMGTIYISAYYNKRGVILDLKSEEDKRAAIELMATADVVLENFRDKGIMARLGLGYDVMSKINPRIIYLQSGAWGADGPYKGMTCNQWFAQAGGGETSLNGRPGEPGEFLRGSAHLDLNAAMLNCFGVLVALYTREKTGRGMMIETNQFKSTVTAGITRMAEYLTSEVTPAPMGSARPNIVPDQAFPTALGYISVSILNNGIWDRFCTAIDIPELASDKRFSTNQDRVKNRGILIPLLESVFVKKAAWQWAKILRSHRVPCGEYVQDKPRTHLVMEHPQVIANRMMQKLVTPWGTTNNASAHWRFSRTTTSMARSAPELGEHQQEIMDELAQRRQSRQPAPVHKASSQKSTGLALEGLRVIDVGEGIPGPLCAMQLGDLGARVEKVEPLDGDWLRQIGPFAKGESGLFIRLNRNKRSIAVDLKAKDGKEVFKRLARGADVIIEGYRPTAMDRLGLGYEELSRENPGLVYCSISGFGSKGPMSDLPASELDMQVLMGKYRQLGLPGDAPLRAGADAVCANAAWAAGQGILAALFSRERTGVGQKVETSLLDAATYLLQWSAVDESDPDEWRGRSLTGYMEPPDLGFQCKDASLLFDISREDEPWKTFFVAIGADHLATDDRFDSFDSRYKNRDALREALRPALSNWSYEDLESLVRGMGGSIVPMHTLKTLVNHPQTEALQMLHSMHHPTVGEYRTLGIPWDFSEPIARLSEAPAPLLGEHARGVLLDLGYSSAEVSSLLASGVVD